MKRVQWLTVLLGCTLLSACGEFAYKQGASANDLANAQKLCKASGDVAAYEKCMQSEGWTVKKLDDWNPVATFVPNTDSRAVGPDAVATGPAKVGAKGEPVVDKSVPPDPMTIFSVGSWWKMGGGAEELKAATNQCANKLGEAHRPAPGSRKMTRGMILCLKEQGWYGLQGE